MSACRHRHQAVERIANKPGHRAQRCLDCGRSLSAWLVPADADWSHVKPPAVATTPAEIAQAPRSLRGKSRARPRRGNAAAGQPQAGPENNV